MNLSIQRWEADVAKLIYAAIASLDGYVEDAQGGFDWAAPDEEVHAFVNELERPIGTYLYGRRMYETMVYWETAGGDGRSPVSNDFAEIWRGGGEGGLLPHPRYGFEPADEDRARVRPCQHQTTQGELGARPDRGWRRTRSPGDGCRTGRRVPSLPPSGPCRWWKERACPKAYRPDSSCWASSASGAGSSTSTTGWFGADRCSRAAPCALHPDSGSDDRKVRGGCDRMRRNRSGLVACCCGGRRATRGGRT